MHAYKKDMRGLMKRPQIIIFRKIQIETTIRSHFKSTAMDKTKK